MAAEERSEFVLDPADPERLANLSGPFDAHLRQMELRLGTEIANRGNVFRVTGPPGAVQRTEKFLRALWDEADDQVLDSAAIHLRLAEVAAHDVVRDDIEPQ